MFVVRISCLIALTASTSLMAQQTHQTQQAVQIPPATVTGEKPASADKMICKLTSTGTSIPKRICLPRSEWAKTSERSDDALRSMRDWQRVRCNFGSTC